MIDAPTPSSLPRAAWRSKKAWATVKQRVVPRGLEVGLPRGDHPPRRERGEDGVGEPDGQAGPAADEEALPPLLEVRAREDVLLDAVVPEVVDAGVEVRDPEGLGLELQGERLLDLHRRRGDVERPDPGQLHRGREVDRQALRRPAHPSRPPAVPSPPGRGSAAAPEARFAPTDRKRSGKPAGFSAPTLGRGQDQRGGQRRRLRQHVAPRQQRRGRERQQPVAIAPVTHASLRIVRAKNVQA